MSVFEMLKVYLFDNQFDTRFLKIKKARSISGCYLLERKFKANVPSTSKTEETLSCIQ